MLDLSTNIAGPTAAMILGDLGADVIKIERSPAGDDTRALPPTWNGQSTVFLAVNRNKRSVLLDLKRDGTRDALHRLAESADVIIESFPPGIAAKLGLEPSDWHEFNPQLIVCSITAFGDGPIGSSMSGYDALVQAVSGIMSFTGHPSEPPVRLAPSVLDFSTGMWAAMSIMAALSRRAQCGEGAIVSAALLDSAFALMGHQLIAYLATGELPEKLGSAAPSAAPYRAYEAQDGYLMIATASDAQFPRLVAALGLVVEPHFQRMPERIRGRAELDRQIQKVIHSKTVNEWLDLLGAAGISAGRVNDIAEALVLPVSRERRPFIGVGGIQVPRLPVDPNSDAVRRSPPALGEHTHEVLAEVGLSQEQIDQLI